ncbi:MAG: hypothetical protein WAW39_28905 [Prosthecobacter sp.]|uniref:hypothetical protein n=1 Tax=Prosthecobacter sp. TaxID=1965333 RepID=UPI003BB1F59D
MSLFQKTALTLGSSAIIIGCAKIHPGLGFISWGLFIIILFCGDSTAKPNTPP